MNEKKKLLKDLEKAIQKTRYTSSVTEYPKTFMPHHKDAILDNITPVIDRFFEENLIQAKESIWT